MDAQEEMLQRLHKKKKHYQIFSEDESDASSEASFVRLQSPTPQDIDEDFEVDKAIQLLRSKGLYPAGALGDSSAEMLQQLPGPSGITECTATGTVSGARPKKKEKTPTLLESVRGMFFSGPIEEDVQSVSSLTRSINSEPSTGAGRRGRGKGKGTKTKKDSEIEEVSEKIKNDLVAFEKHLERKMSFAFKRERDYTNKKTEEIENQISAQIHSLIEERKKDVEKLEQLENDLSQCQKKKVQGVDDDDYTFIKQLKIFRSGVQLDQYVGDATIDDDKGSFFQMQNNMGFNKTNEINGIEYDDYMEGTYIRVWDLCAAGPDRSSEIVPTVSAGIYSLELELSGPAPIDIAMCMMYDQPSLLTLTKGGFMGTSYMQ